VFQNKKDAEARKEYIDGSLVGFYIYAIQQGIFGR
jgi:hypothetical protein